MELLLEDRAIRAGSLPMLGSGGEADVFDLGDGRALKIFKDESHPELAQQPAAQAAARARLALQQRKLPAFPLGLPAAIAAPLALARTRPGAIAGYAMRRIASAEPLLRFGEPLFHKAGASSARVVRVFRALRPLVEALHARGVLIGDFNDLNVLVQGDQPFLIDADSFQFESFPCVAFTERFLDPRLAGPRAQAMLPALPFDAQADWFAFAALLTQSLLLAGPWAGVHQPRDPSRKIGPARRALERVSIFRDEVKLPKAAQPREALPDDLLHELSAVFERDERRPFPAALLDRLSFHGCPSCGLEHARAACPRCRPHAAAPLAQVAAIHGAVLATTLLETRGPILFATAGARGLEAIWHDGRAYRRTGSAPAGAAASRLLFEAPLDPSLRVATLGEASVLARGPRLELRFPLGAPRLLEADLSSDASSSSGAPLFAVHGERLIWSSGGTLFASDARALSPAAGIFAPPPRALGEIVARGTRLWLGPRFGLGFTRAGALTQVFTFSPERRGLAQSSTLPRASGFLAGHLLDARCALADGRAWLLLALQDGPRRLHRALLFDARAALLAQAEAAAGDGSWLGGDGRLPEILAAGELLFAAGDDGLVRLEQRQARIAETRRFPDTAPLLGAQTGLLLGSAGIVAVGPRCVRALRLE